MKVLVANLGSTSFKYRLFDMAGERQLARGGVERIGAPESRCFAEIGERRSEDTRSVPDHAVAVQREWGEEFPVLRWGFHGASHRYIAERTAELTGRRDLRLISCHLGGSSSLCAIRDGCSVATSMGMSPQSGLPQNNRIGDFDL